MSKSKKKHVAETLNKKAIKELYTTTLKELSKLDNENTREKECLTLLHGLDTELDIVMGDHAKPAFTVETQTNLKYLVE